MRIQKITFSLNLLRKMDEFRIFCAFLKKHGSDEKDIFKKQVF